MSGYRIFEISSLAVMTAVLLLDLILVIRRPRVPSMREASAWVAFYVGLALVFAATLLVAGGAERAGLFVTGWLLEYSLSVDNLFVFLVVIARFAVPEVMQQRVLMVGILIAILLRGIFILAGVSIIESFSWVFYLFGAYLVHVAWRQAIADEDDAGSEEGLVIRVLRSKAHLTPFVLVILSLGSIDLLFALDSIPAIFSVTTDPFLVFACTVFALMGLRQLYFLLGDLLDRLAYLHVGIAAILGFIGVKLVLRAMETNEVAFINGGHPISWVPHLQTWHSLLVIVVAMAVAIGASLLTERTPAQRPPSH